MESKFFPTLLNWLKSTELFARPSKQIPGRWRLFEYYTEQGNDLLNLTQDQLQAQSQSWNIEFTNDYCFTHDCRLPIWQINKVENGTWKTSKNYLNLISLQNEKNQIEFQFAIEKENLRLLKKDELGRIEFFGFFNKMP